MAVPQQLPQIPVLRTRYPDPRKAIFQHELQQKSRILAVGLPLLNSLGLDLGRIADPQLETKLRQQPLEPAGKSGSLHAYPHADPSLVQVPIESFCFSLTVVQLLFIIFTGLFHQKCNLLKARVVIHAYNHHVRLLSPGPVVVEATTVYSGGGVGTVMQSSALPNLFACGPVHKTLLNGGPFGVANAAD